MKEKERRKEKRREVGEARSLLQALTLIRCPLMLPSQEFWS